MNKNSLPWQAIKFPKANDFTALRVSAESQWNFWWAVNAQGDRLLVLRLEEDHGSLLDRIPLLAGLDIHHTATADGSFLTIRLLDIANEELFFHLCQDIIAASEARCDEVGAVDGVFERIWRWHYLLESGRMALLSDSEQKGLVGEMVLLRDLMIPELGPISGLNIWTGPDGAPKDFELNDLAFECKARRGAASGHLEISSADQLDTSHVRMMYLVITDLYIATTDDVEGFTVSELANDLLESCKGYSDVAQKALLQKLTARGLRLEDDYSNHRWKLGKTTDYRIDDEFPRIEASTLPAGIGRVKYQLLLGAISPFEVSRRDLVEAIRGVHHGR
jgi:hypothetical protein